MNSQVPKYLLNTNTTHLGNIGNFSNFSNTATKTGEEVAKFAGFNNLMSGIGAGVSAVASIGSLWSGISAADKADRRAKEQLDFAKTQFNTENERYKKREEERLEANKAVAESAKLYDVNPMTRK
ncbi:Uncharacterised protein [Helicobacter cinaedi]|uniref:Uncharacterized protein n=2 Tax=Helicobacter cinaedi TaxID=213 RepID=A0A377JTD5_9HELI|nr:hypothetical protein [Helicobacter cinaedi]STP11053.1 Uncharacterised protein [Helicobacter cinaedi]